MTAPSCLYLEHDSHEWRTLRWDEVRPAHMQCPPRKDEVYSFGRDVHGAREDEVKDDPHKGLEGEDQNCHCGQLNFRGRNANS